MNCPKCGNNVPEGSTFCNHCGSALPSDIYCPSCGNTIPASSAFCPKCGQMIRHNNTAAEGETFNQQQERLRQQQQQQSEPWAQNNNNDDDNIPPSNFNRNLIIGIGIVVAVIIILMILRTCGNENIQDYNAQTTDSTLTEFNALNARAIFNSELGRSNYMGDGATTAFALAVPEHNGIPNYILGVTYASNPTNRSFYKIYKLTENGKSWLLEQLHTQYLNGRSLSFDNAELIANETQTPRTVSIDGRDYLYMAFINMPLDAHVGGTGRVSLILFDVEAKQLISLDYDGIINVREDGRQYVYGKPLQSVNSSLTRFLAQESQSIRVIYVPTPEELLAQQEQEQDSIDDEGNNPNAADNPSDNWLADNAGKMSSISNGEETALSIKTYDKPIFKMEDKHKSVQNNEFIVFSDKTGGVYGFNKNSRKYFVIYKPASPTTPTEIGFADTENSILNMRTASGRLQYNLKTDKIKANNE